MSPQGWRTTDEQELKLRQDRARNEPMRIDKLTANDPVFADYLVTRTDQDSPQTYQVELRTIRERHNYCTCPDFTKNLLGTCKHIEKVLMQVHEQLGEQPTPSSPFVEIFLGRSGDDRPQVIAPAVVDAPLGDFIGKYMNELAELKAPWQTTLQVLLRDLPMADLFVTNQIRVSRAVQELAEELHHRQELTNARHQFEQDVLDGKRSLQVLREPLYDYQVKGMMHLAFSGRAMLADEMGLGKTVQALAAAMLMRQLWSIKRVLIVSPASLKTEWEEQIRRFTDQPISLVDGSQADRERLYKSSRSVFYLMHYEQILRDEELLNGTLRPDLIILDEAQRIKNWQTQTAQSIKRLHSEYAFVLTGTPLENRIDEIYSIVEFINPRIFGSLFRFNREFYELDSDGRVTGYRNLAELQERLRPVMMRRRKSDIATQLPPRVDNNYFVSLTTDQRERYRRLEAQLATTLRACDGGTIATEQFQQIQKTLGTMRMICNSPYILDETQRDAPKVDELVRILDDVWENRATRKVIVFSAWEKMLQLIRERLERAGIEVAWHTGSVPAGGRDEQLARFKTEESCKVLLTTDAGAHGLNLQMASVVVNVDLPWNPARLEQRVARAWRTHQKRSVSVVNLIAEETIEHRILHLLQAKQSLADLILDGDGDLAAMELADGRNTFVRQLTEMIDMRATITPTPVASQPVPPARPRRTVRPVAPVELFKQELILAMGPGLLSFQGRLGDGGELAVALIVVKADVAAATRQIATLLEKTHHHATPILHVLNETTYDALRSLAAGGLATLHDQSLQDFYHSEATQPSDDEAAARRRQLADPLISAASRKLNMAQLLAEGGFAIEAVEPAREACDLTGRALATLLAHDHLTQAPEAFSQSWLPTIRRHPAATQEHITALSEFSEFHTTSETAAKAYLSTSQKLHQLSTQILATHD